MFSHVREVAAAAAGGRGAAISPSDAATCPSRGGRATGAKEIETTRGCRTRPAAPGGWAGAGGYDARRAVQIMARSTAGPGPSGQPGGLRGSSCQIAADRIMTAGTSWPMRTW